jgi:RNA polymerase sigma-70 factor (ECF subfamily)
MLEETVDFRRTIVDAKRAFDPKGDCVDEDVIRLVTRARRRDPTAFTALIERYERTALAVAYAQVHDAHRAGDAVQEGFLRAWQELPRLQEAVRFGGWLLQIVKNAAIDARRRIRPSVAEFPDLASKEADPAEELDEAERAGKVKEALGQLDETTRTAVVMRYYEGLSAKEIGAALEMTPAAVDMRLSRARGELRELLGPLVGEPQTAPETLGGKHAGESA